MARVPIQRYHETGRAPAGNPAAGYVPARSRAARPSFRFQSLRVNRLPDAAAAPDPNVRRYQLEHVEHTEATPTLRVADANDLAVPAHAGAEAKTFFATAAQIESSNVALHEAGAPLRLVRRSGRVTVPQHGARPAAELSAVATQLPPNALTSSECGQFAQDVLGKAFSEGVVAGAATPITGGPGRDARIAAAVAAPVAAPLGVNRDAGPEVGEAFGIFAPQAPAAAPGVLGAAIGALGSVYQRLFVTTPYLRWGEHWAGVIARSGDDRVTLENYNRATGDSAKIEEAVEHDYRELRGLANIQQYELRTQQYARANAGETSWQRLRRLGRDATKYAVSIDRNVRNAGRAANRWYFQMYGPGAQSFHAQWQNAVPQATTFRMQGTDAALQARLVAQLNALVPNDAYRAGAAATLAAEVANVNNAAGYAAIRAAYVTGARNVAAARLSAAAVVIRRAARANVRPRITAAEQAALLLVNAASGDAIGEILRAQLVRMRAIR